MFEDSIVSNDTRFCTKFEVGDVLRKLSHFILVPVGPLRGEFRLRQTRQLPRAVDLKGRLLSCQSY